VTRSVGGLQAFVRAGLIRKKIVNQKKELDFIQPDVLGIQAQCRGMLARLEWRAWFVHVHSSIPTAIFLQSLTRGFLVRRQFFERLMHVSHLFFASSSSAQSL
jgi:Ras GTPase-activating-like protein IQGAP2/3